MSAESEPTVEAALAYNVSEYSHSTVFTLWRNSVVIENAPPLTTQYKAPETCHNRWMLVENEATSIIGTTTTISFVQPRPAANGTSTVHVPASTATGALTVTSVESPTIVTPTSTKSTNNVAKREASQGAIRIVKRGLKPDETVSWFQYTVWSIDSNPLFKSCQPYSDEPLYSPGICPDGQQVVEVTEIIANKTDGGGQTSWQASCCRSGMTFGPDVSRFCQSTITTPIPAHAYITTSNTSLYEVVTSKGGTASTISQITTLGTRLAVADPVVVAWDLEEMAQFPTDYRASLAKRIGVALPTSTSKSATFSEIGRNPEKSSNPASAGPGIGAKAGIGVGVAVGIMLLLGLLVFYLVRRRKARQLAIIHGSNGIDTAEMEDQDATNARRKWFLGGRWRNEAEVRTAPTPELDSRTVHVVPGFPVELRSEEAKRFSRHIKSRP